MKYKKIIFLSIFLLSILIIMFLDEKLLIDISPFYIIIVGISAWLLDKKAVIFISIISFIAWEYETIKQTKLDDIFLWNLSIKTFFFMVVIILINIVKEMYKKNYELALTDSLTNVANRRRFYIFIEDVLNRLKRYNIPFSISYIDIDEFKKINDNFGHNEGDRILKETAFAIKKQIRVTDLVARIGGDEFVIILTDTDEIKTKEVINRIKTELKSITIKGKPITCSIGSTVVYKTKLDVDALIKIADKLMYVVKKSGKNGIKFRILKN